MIVQGVETSPDAAAGQQARIRPVVHAACRALTTRLAAIAPAPRGPCVLDGTRSSRRLFSCLLSFSRCVRSTPKPVLFSRYRRVRFLRTDLVISKLTPPPRVRYNTGLVPLPGPRGPRLAFPARKPEEMEATFLTPAGDLVARAGKRRARAATREPASHPRREIGKTWPRLLELRLLWMTPL